MLADALLAPAVVEVAVIAGGATVVGVGTAAVKSLKRIKRDLAAVHDIADRVESQVTPNGGQSDSLGDRARRTEETVSRMADRLIDHESRLVGHSNQLDHIEQALATASLLQASHARESSSSVTVNTSAPQQARRTPLPPPPPGASE